MVPILSFARAPQSLCFLFNLTHSSEDVGGITVHQDNSHLVSGELSHKKGLSVAEFLGKEHSARVPHASTRYGTTQPGTHLQDALLGHAQCTALESSCEDLWGSCLTHDYVCRAAQAQSWSWAGKPTHHSSVFLIWWQVHRAAFGELQLMVVQRKTQASVRVFAGRKLLLDRQGKSRTHTALTCPSV